MYWYKKSSSALELRNRITGAVVLLSAGVLFSQPIFAEVRSFSVVHEKFELNRTSPDNNISRLERLRRFFLLAPLEGTDLTISSEFGLRIHPVLNKKKPHNGVDYAAPKGTPIQTTADGTVEFIGRKKGYGKVIVIRHNANLTTIYAHQSRFAKGVKKGDAVFKGGTIGYVGSTGTATGNHLHYEIRIDGRPINPLKLDRLYAENEYSVSRLN